MQALHPDLRKKLEKAVIAARDVAEEAAAKALGQLGVGAAAKPDYLTDEEAALRRRLRARGRALGDERKPDGTQETQKLVREAAYEQWHRLLFARFLLENDLLMHPEFDVPLGLEDCEEIAKDETRQTGERTDGFEVAARFAEAMLPQIFRTDDVVLDVRFALEDRTRLKRQVTGLAPAVFKADDALGWVYQFWQAKRKDEVNASGVKIGADELPAVTQLFTEEYMVRFLLENTLGAWWAARYPGEDLPVEMPYLRFLEDRTPAAGGFDGWPDQAAELKVMDPCMGSGHFLVATLHLLVPMRMTEEGLTAQEAVDRVLAENLHGLELDLRCTQIAAFALALAAWTYPGAEGYRRLPAMNLACSGLAPTARLYEWIRLAGDDERLQNGMRRLWTLFQDAPTLGSLIDPGQAQDDLMTAGYNELQPLLAAALEREEGDEEAQSQEVVAYGVTKAAELLGGGFHLVTTNVPYLGRGEQGKLLRDYLLHHFQDGRSNLATAFVARILELLDITGTMAVVSPMNWFTQPTYENFRKKILQRRSWVCVARLGPGAFDTITGEVVNVSLKIISNTRPNNDHHLFFADALDQSNSIEKALTIKGRPLSAIHQLSMLKSPGATISPTDYGKGEPLEVYADSYQGIKTGDNPKLNKRFWEIGTNLSGWKFEQSTTNTTTLHGGRDNLIWWDKRNELARFQGQSGWGRLGVILNQMGYPNATLHTGDVYDGTVACIIPKHEADLPAIWAFCSSSKYAKDLRQIETGLAIANSAFLKVPFDHSHWQKFAEKKYPHGLPKPQSNDLTQWLFHGHPAHAEDPNTKFAAPLHVAVARLVGYHWPAEQDEDMELADEARALVREAAALDAYADDDGIVCLPSVARERPASDRLHELLRVAFGSQWNAGLLQKLLEQEGVKRGGLEKWLLDKFFQNHSQFFGNRPFIWHIWDGHREGFSALVNYHKLDRAGLEKLTYTYLGTDWIARQRKAVEDGEEGAEGRLAAAEALQRKLKLILEGEPPYDIFVRWKPLEEQPIGWQPDLNDGVLVNIWPFVEADVLRHKPKIKWTKDRGKNPEGEPWGPDRHNRYEDLDDEYKLRDDNDKVIPHLTNAVKKKARAEAARK